MIAVKNLFCSLKLCGPQSFSFILHGSKCVIWCHHRSFIYFDGQIKQQQQTLIAKKFMSVLKKT